MSNDNLTLAAFGEAYRRALLAGKIVYAISDAVSPDKAILVSETEGNYAYCIFHDEATAQRIAAEAGLELLPLRDAPMKPAPPMRGPIALDPETERQLALLRTILHRL